MAFAAGFEFDLFISYASVDDAEAVDNTGRGWVTLFVHHLEAVLASRLGGKEKLRIYFDRRSLGGNQQILELLDAVGRSALFLAVASPAYANRDWTARELGAFIKQTSDTRRLFAVDYLPLDDGEVHQPPLDTHKRLKFWEIDEATSFTPMPLSVSGPLFRTRIHDLADQLKKQLVSINAAEAARPAIRQVAETIAEDKDKRAKGVVYLAQTVDDLEEERLEVQRYLEQFGFLILPATELPGGGEAFRTAADEAIRQCDLYVHLLGPRGGRYPPDLPAGYGGAQIQSAKAAGKELALWRHPELDVEKVSDPRQRGLLTDAAVIACGLESMKAEVRRRLEARTQANPRKSKVSSLVFINAIETDYDVAKIVQQEFNQRSMPTMLPIYAGTAEEVHADLTENMRDCDLLVIIYGTAPQTWIRSQIRLFSKLKAGSHATLVAIFVGPPGGKSNDLGFFLPDLRWIEVQHEWSMEPIRSLIAELEA